MDFRQARVSENKTAAGDDLRRFVCAAQWTRVGHIEANATQLLLQHFGLSTAGSIQRDIQLALKSLFAVPVGLPVPHQHESSLRHLHPYRVTQQYKTGRW